MMTSQYVIIIAPETDLHAQVVAKRLETLNARAIILDSALFPSLWRLTIQKSNNATLQFTLECGDVSLNEDEVVGVWWRRPRQHLAPEPVSELHLRKFIVNESKQAFDGWLYCLGNRVINPISADFIAGHKLLQLKCATEVGLRIPFTVAGNSPAKMRSFYKNTKSEIVFKAFTGTHWQFIGTQRLSMDTLRHLDYIKYSPVIFQEQVKKVTDIRVNIIDNEIFAISISSKRPDAPLDWRIDPVRDYCSHKLPQNIKDALLDLVHKLGLRFAACDLALTEQGEYVFFELNPGGQWLFAEIMTGQELSLTFAKALLNKMG